MTETVWKFYDELHFPSGWSAPVEIVKSSMDIDTSSRSELDIMKNTNEVDGVDIDSDVLSPASTMAEKPPHPPKKTQQIVKQGKSKLSPSDDLLLSCTKVISSVAKRQNISAGPINETITDDPDVLFGKTMALMAKEIPDGMQKEMAKLECQQVLI